MSIEANTVQTQQASTLSYAARSDIGMRREENQDSLGIIENGHFRAFVVADGMGGVRGGAIASQLAIASFKQAVLEQGSVDPDSLRAAVEFANAEIFDRGLKDPGLSGMGTTFVGVVFVGSQMILINVGDSRAYRIRAGEITQLSQDHTLVMELLRSGTISPEQVHNHPVSHMLTRSLGPAESVEVDCEWSEELPRRGDMFLLCSDGLYNLVKDSEVKEALSTSSLEEGVQRLVDLANKRGGTDNITVIAIAVGPDFPELSEASAEYQQGLNGESDHNHLAATPGKEPGQSLGYYSASGQRADLSALWDQSAEIDLIDEQQDTELADEEASTQDSQVDQQGVEADLEQKSDSQETDYDATSPSVEERISFESLRHGRPEIEIEQEKVWARDEASSDRSAHDAKAQQTEDTEGSAAAIMKRPASQGVLARILFVVPFLLGASLGGVAVAALLYSPEGRQQSLARLVERSVPETQEHGSISTHVTTLPPSDAAVTAPSSAATIVSEDQNQEKHEDLSETSNRKEVESPQAENSTKPGDELSGIEKRKALLEARITELDEKITAFDGPLSGRLGEVLKNSGKEIDSLDQRLEEVRNEIDIATRKLAVWYGRRKRLETVSPIDMASEVAVSSDAVREKKQLFESTTWEYLKQSEHFRYNPSDTAQAQKVSDLLRLRKQHMEDLSESVKTTVDRSIAESDQHITDLTVERDQIQAKIQNLQSDVQLVKIISGNDRVAREAKKAELVRERELVKAEIVDLSPH